MTTVSSSEWYCISYPLTLYAQSMNGSFPRRIHIQTTHPQDEYPSTFLDLPHRLYYPRVSFLLPNSNSNALSNLCSSLFPVLPSVCICVRLPSSCVTLLSPEVRIPRGSPIVFVSLVEVANKSNFNCILGIPRDDHNRVPRFGV